MRKNFYPKTRITPLSLLCFFVLCTLVFTSIDAAEQLITSVRDYKDQNLTQLPAKLEHRIEMQPFNLISLAIFVCAIIHTFFTHHFTSLARKIDEAYNEKKRKRQAIDPPFDIDPDLGKDKSFLAELFHFLGEVEAVFFIWVIPLVAAIAYFYDWHTAVEYIQSRSYVEPMFVVVIMAVSATRPIVNFAEQGLTKLASLGKGHPAAWWLSILTIGPLLGSLITEPAAMTLCAMLLSKQFYKFNPRSVFKYATLGLLFTNISVGGTLTHFAAPPVLMVADAWGWSSSFMLQNFGWKSVVGILLSNSLYFSWFRKEFGAIEETRQQELSNQQKEGIRPPVPLWITIAHLLLLAWVIVTNHYPAMFVGGFLLFLAFYEATAYHQNIMVLRGPILVGCFLAGLVIHGGLQSWWISAILNKASDAVLMVSAIALTAFNDNAAITYLSSLVPHFSESAKYFVVAGAVAGGGLTVIANAPNPAGYSLLNRYFTDGISPGRLFLAAAIPTLIVTLCLGIL